MSVNAKNPLQYLVGYKNRHHFSLADAASYSQHDIIKGTNMESVSEVLEIAYELLLTNLIDF